MGFYSKYGFAVVFALLFAACKTAGQTIPAGITAPEGMVWVPGKTFIQGAKADDPYAMAREKPAHTVTVSGFFMDEHEVTNRQFRQFTDATGYVTVAERPTDWDELKKEVPPGTPKPADSLLQPGCMVFNRNARNITGMDDYSQWWQWKAGVNWRHPEGRGTTIDGKENFPVVHIAYEDALAYCKWAHRRLPTEAEWEAAAQGTNNNTIFTWGNDMERLTKMANTWQGTFPVKNVPEDGYAYIAPVESFPPNSIGLYDMLGNVWEWTSDFYDPAYYGTLSGTAVNPKGPDRANNPSNPYQQERVIKGGSYLCNASYCASFRISARMPMTPDSGADHVGFRTVATPDMLQ